MFKKQTKKFNVPITYKSINGRKQGKKEGREEGKEERRTDHGHTLLEDVLGDMGGTGPHFSTQQWRRWEGTRLWM